MNNIYPFRDPKVLKNEASEWLIKLDGDNPLSSSDKKALREWLAQSSEHREALTQLARVWDNLNVLAELSIPLDKPSKRHRIFPWLQAIRFKLSWPRVGFLTSLATVLFVFSSWFSAYLWQNAIEQSNGVYITQVGKQQKLTLADGSKVQLNTNSQIKVAYGKHYRDITLLKGEAHFEVVKDKKLPFRVFAGAGRVQAIGTAFSVQLKRKIVSVIVSEGLVALASISELPYSERDTPPDEVLSNIEDLGALSAGQAASIVQVMPDKNNGFAPVIKLDDIQIYKEEELQRQLAWRQGLLMFNGERLEEVVDEISRYTTMNISIPSAKVRNIKVGGQFEVGDTDMMLKSLEDVFSLNIKREGIDQITILAGDFDSGNKQ